MKVTKHTKSRLWQDMRDLARFVRYYEMQTNQLTRNHRFVRLFLLVGAGATLTLAVGDLPGWVGIAGSFILLVATAVEFIWDWGTKASLSHAINLECCVIEKDYEDLWSRVKTGQATEQECLEKVNQLSVRVIAATALLTETDEGINNEAYDRADEVLEAKWRSTSDKQSEASATA